jgi:hypothetical protein
MRVVLGVIPLRTALQRRRRSLFYVAATVLCVLLSQSCGRVKPVAYSHSHPDTHSSLDGNAHSHADSDSDTDAHRLSYTNADCPSAWWPVVWSRTMAGEDAVRRECHAR